MRVIPNASQRDEVPKHRTKAPSHDTTRPESIKAFLPTSGKARCSLRVRLNLYKFRSHCKKTRLSNYLMLSFSDLDISSATCFLLCRRLSSRFTLPSNHRITTCRCRCDPRFLPLLFRFLLLLNLCHDTRQFLRRQILRFGENKVISTSQPFEERE